MFFKRYPPITQEQKDKFIESFASVAAPYSGAFEAYQFLAAPRRWIVPTLSPNSTYELVKFFAGVYWMSPSDVIYDPETVIAKVEQKDYKKKNEQQQQIKQKKKSIFESLRSNKQKQNNNNKQSNDNIVLTKFSISNITSTFSSTNRTLMLSAMENMQTQIGKKFFAAPNVETVVFYGSGKLTERFATYFDDSEKGYHLWENEGIIESEFGDGTVNSASLRAPFMWRYMQQPNVLIKEYT
ncbi:MAG: hypothetical protein EZS28_045680, partial [Streblomastix strix]